MVSREERININNKNKKDKRDVENNIYIVTA